MTGSGGDCGTEINIQEHGIALDEKKRKVKCNYCGKVVSGFYRLKCHLGSLRGDVLPCEEVPPSVKEPLRAKLLETKRKNLVKQVDQILHPQLPLKRNWTCPKTDDPEELVDQEEQNSHPRRESKPKSKTAQVNKKNAQVVAPLRKPKEPQRYCNVNTSNAKLREEVRRMGKYVKRVRDCWEKTGCSLLLDEWVDEKGRDLVNFLVDCPEGIIYIRSSDLSAFIGEIDALRVLLEEVIEEIGVQNVVQIITSSTTTRMWPAIRHIVGRHTNVYWALESSHYIGVILEKIGMMNPFREILSMAKTLTKFIYGDENLLKLFRFHSHGHDLIKPHRIRSVMAFLNLGNIVSQKQNLHEMVASLKWRNSTWASTTQGKSIVNLLDNLSFWKGAKVLLAATTPILRAVCPINGKSLLMAGYLYESFRRMKEEIKVQLGNKASRYMPFWTIIDEIWDIYLHRPLHSAGYYLNPGIFYTKNFYSDCEVEHGLERCITSMVEDPNDQALISKQLQEYEQAGGGFKDGSGIEAIKDISPAEWWVQYGEECPELQKFAIRVLSQTCDGALRYGLTRSLGEKLLTRRRDSNEQQRLKDITFVNYNLELQNSKLMGGYTTTDNNVAEEEIIDYLR
ncbi:uncharacterized protein LOC116115045 [Pistacia vera]|uniref:uncharacterized protein LOC116111425 n=1 Tax=Pistacia vera TaxID=55513 RepID=UPI0012637DED|nr:uncharacterized protein LOC116111425 [Pistacia vera]XP_031257039.1 uncharacterized protein LOC116115045 [Pistacia vera]